MNNFTGTPHNNAKLNDIAKTVLMPGDPLRAKFIAETFLENPRLINSVRNMFGYTGTYKGKEITVMGSGMGMGSIGIYSYELFSKYNVDNIIRIGSAGSYCEDVKLYDVVLATSAYSESTFAKVQNGYKFDITYPSILLNNKIEAVAKELNIPIHKGRIHSSDVFYRNAEENYYKKLYEDKECLCVEMESFALFHNANVLGKNAACILTISDSFITNEEVSAKDRQTAFIKMMEIALSI